MHVTELDKGFCADEALVGIHVNSFHLNETDVMRKVRTLSQPRD